MSTLSAVLKNHTEIHFGDELVVKCREPISTLCKILVSRGLGKHSLAVAIDKGDGFLIKKIENGAKPIGVEKGGPVTIEYRKFPKQGIDEL